MKTTTYLACTLVALSGATAFAQPQFGKSFRLSVPAGEIIDYDANSGLVYGTNGADGVHVTPVSRSGFGTTQFINITNPFSGAGVDGVSSVAIDPLGRGFGVATVIPDDGSFTGKAVFFNTNDNTILGSFDTGFHPDMVTFANNGNNILIANEGDNDASATPRTGSISNFDISSVSDFSDFNDIDTNSTKTLTDFSSGTLPSLQGLRDYDAVMNRPTTSPNINNVEPEYITTVGNNAYVSLQENNGLGVFDIANNEWTNFINLGSINQTIDASDRDGPGGVEAIDINDTVKGLPQPDTITSFSFGGNTYIATANEGDFAGDDRDRIRVKDLTVATQLDGEDGELDQNSGVDTSDGELGRLRVFTNEGDTDGDGDIDEVVMPGTRSISIWDESGNLVFDTGSEFEEWIAANDPAFFNENEGEGEFDKRSDDKGPEPEALAAVEFEGEIYIFAGMERTSHIFLYQVVDVDGALELVLLDVRRDGDAISPEGSEAFVDADGNLLYLSSYEVSGDLVLTNVPEPSVLPGLFGIAALLLARRRRA